MARTSVLFESWRGLYADSPRSLSEEIGRAWPDARRTWVSSGATGGFPSDVRTVQRHSAAYFARLLSTDLLVANDIISQHLVKGPRTTYVQTWHGTPLKLIGHDERSHAYAGARAHLKRMVRDVATWDYLVSPSSVCSTLFRSAFGYEGPIWETGYPRNDVLSCPDAAGIRSRVRTQLGLDTGVPAVLYAPTWRDDDKSEDGRFRQSVLPDLAALEAALPPGSRFLMRTHKNVTVPVDPRSGETPGFVVDVSAHPEIADLYLAADVLVSDYSSAIFDFAVTRKPIVLFAPDLERYRDDVRGMYFDYEAWAPGPVVTTDEELAAVLADVVTDRAGGWARTTAYDEFVARFCPHEDGHAGERVLERLGSVLGR
ncbi:MAG: CDP-glycerol glycerophosphotransferase family protein [Nocardioidaceae bacterium]